jgi:hypothetical protein
VSGDWLRIVADDASPEQRLGAMTIGELRASKIQALIATLPQQIADALQDEKLTIEQLQTIVGKVFAGCVALIDADVDRIKLRVQGREPMH